ncbi:3-beta hydroxysteroid dehydrogenase/isomerase family protein [Rhizobium sullae]|uniref:3-beta hydroxysteroid dehydrogenase/isomerase family protein n=1 Tax=Rhizobium sullae TaxID=50338 RepID=A0A4R3PTB8_RHISU|nr:3-beta hydroxysteroid dehydrogenase/isomerase family protein [Rhizobium sullae]
MDSIEIDLTSDQSVAHAMAEVQKRAGDRIASVIHLAAYYDTTGEENPKYDAVTVQGTRRLLEALQKLETEQFAFSSTLLVHAPAQSEAEDCCRRLHLSTRRAEVAQGTVRRLDLQQGVSLTRRLFDIGRDIENRRSARCAAFIGAAVGMAMHDCIDMKSIYCFCKA